MMRLSFRGNRIQTVDAPAFNESDHPRDEHGQFTSGGASASGNKINGGVTAPKKGSLSHQIWSIAAKLQESGAPANAKNVMAEATKAGLNLNPATVGVQLGNYKKHNVAAKLAHFVGATAPATAPPKVAEPELPNNLETFTKLGASKGFKTEGTYNGIHYLKNDTGQKISYLEDGHSWQVTSGGSLVSSGIGMGELNTFIGKMKTPAPGSVAPTESAPPCHRKPFMGSNPTGMPQTKQISPIARTG